MPRNPILEELRQIREQLLADAGGTLKQLVAAIQEEERRSDRPFHVPEHSDAPRVAKQTPFPTRNPAACGPQ